MKKIHLLCLLCICMLPGYANSAAISVVTPNGGENWLMGCPQTIQWITAAPMPVQIELFRNGTFYMTIANQVPASQNSFSWTPLYSITPGNTFKVKISSLTSSSGFDVSDNNFIIPGSGATGLKSAESDFHVFPNPCNDILNVKLHGDPGTNTSIMIMNVTGKKVFDQHIIEYPQPEGLTINTADIADGFYILFIQQDEEIIYKRSLVIKH